MVLSLKPFGCMPSARSPTARSRPWFQLQGHDLPADRNFGRRRDQRPQPRADGARRSQGKARMEFDQVLQSTGKRLEDIKEYVADHPELRSLFYPVPHRSRRNWHGGALRAPRKRADGSQEEAGTRSSAGSGKLGQLLGFCTRQCDSSTERRTLFLSGFTAYGAIATYSERMGSTAMAELQTPEGTRAAPSYRLDVELHELLMKPPEQPKLLPPPPGGQLQTLPEPVFPSRPELMNAADEDYFPKNPLALVGC